MSDDPHRPRHPIRNHRSRSCGASGETEVNDIIKKWEKMHAGWKLFSAGTALICTPVAMTHGLTDAMLVAGILCVLAALVYAIGAEQ